MEKRKPDDVFCLVPEPRRVPERSNRATRIWLGILIGFSLCFTTFAFWYYSQHSVFLIRIFNEEDSKHHNASATCSGIPDLEKFDCHPEPDASESSCTQRGCCYQTRKTKNLPPLNVPYCYYPKDFVGYSIGNIRQDGRQITADLTRQTPSGFPNEIKNLNLVITFISNVSVRIKITDANAKRFEVPIPINVGLGHMIDSLYDVNLDAKTGELSVTRKSTNTVIFNTNLSRLVFADQFLQLSSNLPSTYIYGIGEKYGGFLRSVNWTRITLLNSDRAPVPNEPLYGTHPFYLSLEKNGNANGVFLLNSNVMDVILQPTPAITYRPIGGILDFFIMLGPSPANVVQQYTSLIGQTFMPPYWSLGFHLCRYGYNSLAKTKETMQRNIDAGIPIDVQWNDIDYMERFKDFTYDQDNFKELPQFVDELHAKGMHYVIMTDPGISNSEQPGSYKPYENGIKDDVFIKNPNGTYFVGKVWTDNELVYPDFSHPNSTSWWTKLFSEFHDEIKFDGVWIDMNEPSNFYDGGKDGCLKSSYEDPPYLPGGDLPLRRKTICMTAKHYNTIHYNEHNLYAYREAVATNKALLSIRNRRPFIISRASYAGLGVHSGHWSGDISSKWDDLRYTIPSMLNANLYGMSMIGSDICGFGGNTTVEMCMRWQALGSYYPFSRNHNDQEPSIEQDPYALGDKVIAATKTNLGIRYLMLPYLYTLFYHSHVDGATVIRPLFFEYPEDEKTYPIDEQFLWGPALMIAPVLYPGVSQVNAYLPTGVWYGNKGEQILSKGDSYKIPIKDSEVGIFLRGGHIVPGQLSAMTTTESRNNPFLLWVMLDENKQAEGEMYWDDGDSVGTHEAGKYNLLHFSANRNGINTTIDYRGYTTKMTLGNVIVAGMDAKVTKLTINEVACTPQPHSFKKENMLLNTALSAGREVPNAYFCVYDQDSDVVYIGATPKADINLLRPITIAWSF